MKRPSRLILQQKLSEMKKDDRRGRKKVPSKKNTDFTGKKVTY